MVGRTGSIRPEVPRACHRSSRHVLLFFILAGHENFPARRFGTRAKKLPKGKQVPVFLGALDQFCGVGMSKANASRDLNCVANRELLISNHCTPPSDRFVSRIVLVGTLGSLRSPYWKRKVGLAGQNCTHRCRVLGAGRKKAEQRDESLQSANGEYVIEIGAGPFTIGQTSSRLKGAEAATAWGDGVMQDYSRLSSTYRGSRQIKISHRLERLVRGLKSCR